MSGVIQTSLAFAKVQRGQGAWLKSHHRVLDSRHPTSALAKKRGKKSKKELRGEGSEVRSQSHDLTKGSGGRYWRLVTVKVAPSSSSSQTDTGAWRSKEEEVGSTAPLVPVPSHCSPGPAPPAVPLTCDGRGQYQRVQGAEGAGDPRSTPTGAQTAPQPPQRSLE